MHFEFGFYSSLLLIPFSQGFIYSLLLLRKAIRKENPSDYWLSIFVFLCSLYIAPWMLGFAGWYDNPSYRDILFYVPFQHLYFIGPVIYFYIQSLLNPSFRFTRKASLHLLPGLLYLIYILYIWIYDKFVIGQAYFYADGMDKDFDEWYQKTGLLSMAVYFIVTLRYYNLYKKLMIHVVSYADAIKFKWIKAFLYAFLLMLFLPIAFDLLVWYCPELNSYKGSWWFFLFFSIIMYYIAIAGYSNSIQTKIPFHVSAFDNNQIVLLDISTTDANEQMRIELIQETAAETLTPEIEAWKVEIERLIREEKLYRDPELTLTELSKKLQTNAAVISRAINKGFAMNFNDFINHYRIEAVKEMLANGEHKKSTLLGIAFDCGFNSKATFNRAFKKYTGMSPKSFLHKS